MKQRLGAAVLAAAAVLTVVAMLTAQPASSHEARASGGFRLAVGWGDEPAYTGFRNSVQVTISEADGGAPVTDVGDALTVEVTKGSDRVTLPLVANFSEGGRGTPGDYRAWLTPTRPGTYTVRVIGIVRGQAVNETFTSSESTFDDVEDSASTQFPVKDPSPGELATRLEREVPRLDARAVAVETQVADAVDTVDGARTLALVGSAAGVLGLLVALAALIRVPRGGDRRNRSPLGGKARPGGAPPGAPEGGGASTDPVPDR